MSHVRRNYLGREVVVQAASDVLGDRASLGAATVLFVSRLHDASGVDDALRTIASAHPLAIVLAGAAASKFDVLLDILSRDPTPHVMTSLCDGDDREALEVLLNATWPADQRFDEWQRYAVVVDGDAADVARMCLLLDGAVGR